MPFLTEDGTNVLGIESAFQLWQENDVPGIRWPRCCCGGTCNQNFAITGCNSSALSGATVSVYVSNGGALLAQGVTPSNGIVALSWTGSCSVYVTVTCTGSTGYGQSLTLTPSGTTTISLSPGSGYGCCSGFSGFLPLTLYATASGQSTTLTANVISGVITSWTSGLWGSFSGPSDPNVAVVTVFNPSSCFWNGVSYQTTYTQLALRLPCPTSTTNWNMTGIGCVVSASSAIALCPSELCLCGLTVSCNPVGLDGPNGDDSFTLTGTVGSSVSVSGTLPTNLLSFGGYVIGAPLGGSSIVVTS